jgi:peptidoglycan/xylan/chitin deacetylase (PgdA/CDA1 family)
MGQRKSGPLDAPAIQVASAAGLLQEEPVVAAPAPQDPTVVWVANHTQTTLWDGPGQDALPIGRLPVGSYFRVIGDGVGERLPVAYPGNRTVAAAEGWIGAADIGPIPEPSADWTEPDFPPRRLVVGEREELIRGDPSLPLIALTFDAGADVGTTPQLLDVLRDRGVRSTFFIAGAYADRYPGVIARMADEGHELANHSYNHPDFRNLSEAQMRTEIRRGTAAIETASGVRVVPLWRPPYGSRNSQILRVVAEEGFRSVFWTFDSGDWIVGATVNGITSTDLGRAVPGAVVVHHVSPSATAQAMPAIIDELRRRGYQLVTVSELIGP